MAHKKAAGTTKNGRDSNPRYLGIKLADGDVAQVGSIIVRQKGVSFLAGRNTKIGKDYTVYAVKDGKVKFATKRKMSFDSKMEKKGIVSVI
ncbi:MAG: 50S ribosomal protein L27 [Candidatus Taylorbacteria bacterium RIFOXYD2_FULL_36_9]|uniref:Large ribosomal subunit protein bL27 n=1 Tax=Candidatus Taylorbacteria bacterium RIFOXYD2_FULL_36_9 TaxID=1802338 RepID=A0A1G2PG09_9BACT|nr:MAG: 50S ribosomal protein L27 [Candidatus Taylorbacteria bacterium RIFOXYD2_FULL_36_9]